MKERSSVIKMVSTRALIITIILAAVGTRADYKIKEIKPGFVMEEIGEVLVQHEEVKINLILKKSEVKRSSGTLKGFIEKIKNICDRHESEVCRNPIATEIEATLSLVEALYDEQEQKSKRDVSDVILEMFGWKKIDSWDEYNLNVIKENEEALQANIKSNTKFMTEIRNYVIEEKQHTMRKLSLLEEALNQTMMEVQAVTNNTIIELSLVEMILILEGQVKDLERQLNSIAHSVDRTQSVTATEVVNLIKNVSIVSQIGQLCGKHRKTSLNRAVITTKNEKEYLNTTISIPVYETNKLKLFKLTAIPKVVKKSVIQIPQTEKAYIGVTENSHQYVEWTNVQNECEIEEHRYFCKINRIKTYNKESSCAAKAMFSNNTNEGCVMQTILIETGYYYQKLATGGDYLYVLTEQKDNLIECENSRRVENLKGTGIISLDKHCRILDNYDALYPTSNTAIQLSRYLKTSNWSSQTTIPTKKLVKLSVILRHESLTNLPQLEPIVETPKFELKELKISHKIGISMGTMILCCLVMYCACKCGCCMKLLNYLCKKEKKENTYEVYDKKIDTPLPNIKLDRDQPSIGNPELMA